MGAGGRLGTGHGVPQCWGLFCLRGDQQLRPLAGPRALTGVRRPASGLGTPGCGLQTLQSFQQGRG